MSQAPAMPVFTDALLGDTMHLSAEEFGAYCLLLFATWRNNGEALPDEDHRLARICKVTERRWRVELRSKMSEFFDISSGSWKQKRLEKEWKYVSNRAKISRENGMQGGRRKALKFHNNENPAGYPEGTLEGTQEEPTQTHTHTQEELPPNGGRQNAPDRRVIAERMVEIWKQELGGMLTVPSKLTQDRITHANARFKDSFDGEHEKWREFCQAMRGKPFLIGDNDRQWRASFDWAIKEKSIIGVREGKYDNLGNSQTVSNKPLTGGYRPMPSVAGG